MPAILVRPNGEYYNIDVVKSIKRSMPTDVTSNPVEDGSSISDHVVLKNKTWTIEGVTSDANFKWVEGAVNTVRIPDSIVDWRKNFYADQSAQVKIQKNPGNHSLSVKTNRQQPPPEQAGSLTRRLADIAGNQLGSISQFFKKDIKVNVNQSGEVGRPNTVTVSTTRVSTNLPSKPTVTNSLGLNARAWEAYELLVLMRDNKEVVTLIHSSGEFDDLVIKDVSIDRDASISVRNFVFTLNLEQVQVVDKAKTVAVAKLPKAAPRPAVKVEAQCDGKKDGGKATPTDVSTTTPAQSDSAALRYLLRPSV